MPDQDAMALARPGHAKSQTREEEYRREIRKLLVPTIRDAKTALLQLYAVSQLADRSPVERFSAGVAFSNQGIQVIRSHMAICACDGDDKVGALTSRIVGALNGHVAGPTGARDVAEAVRAAVTEALAERTRLSEELLEATEENLDSCKVPGISQDVERNRHEGLIKYKLHVPEMGSEFDSVCLPDHLEGTRDDLLKAITGRVLTNHLNPIIEEVLQMLVDHGLVPFELEKTVVDIRNYRGVTGDGGRGAGAGSGT